MSDPDFDILALYREAALEVGNHVLEDLTLDTKLADLTISSVEVLEIVGYIEQRLNIRLNDEDLSRMTCMRDLVRLIETVRTS
jgi:acyl carrier protein